MRVVFFGTPDVALVSLHALLASRHQVVGCVTQPDRPKGRSGTPAAPPVKTLALKHDIVVLQPQTPKEEGFAQTLASLQPDVCAVVAYGHLLPQDVLGVPRKGTVNVHFSLLPKFRGAAPVQRAVMAGETETGVSIFLLEPTLDTGPVIVQQRTPIEPDDTAGSLFERLSPTGAKALLEALDSLEHNTAEPLQQDDSEATPAPKIKPEDARIDWSRHASQVRNQIRGLNPAPGAFTTLDGRRIKVWAAALAPGTGAPGDLIDPPVTIACGDGALQILELQPEGKRRMSPEEFARGARLGPTTRFGLE